MTVQETMTKEQILEILNNVYRNHMTPGIATRIIHQQLSAERERGQQFPTTEQMDAAINVSIGKMFGGLEAASIDHFLQTGKINGSFRQRLHDCIKSASMLVDIKQKTEHLKQLSAERERAAKLVGALNIAIGVFDLTGYEKTSKILKEYIKEYQSKNQDHTNPSS